MSATGEDRRVSASQPDLSRRKFLHTATAVYGTVGAAFAAVPFIESWLIVAPWRRHPVFVLHRTAAQLQVLQEPNDTHLLRDPKSEVLQQPRYAKNWHRSIKPEYLIVVGICTHLGCVPRYEPQPDGARGPSWPGGYFCPCHGSLYDLSARVFTGVPAPYNLPVPPHRFLGESKARIGENPPGSTFEFSSIAQL
jgi:ubiquinol-cytochrome c reductase iron-sulfur subunit